MTRKHSISLSDSVVVSPAQVSCDVEGETIILSVASGEYFTLNAVASFIWTQMQHTRGVEELRDMVLDSFQDAPADRCTQELLELLEQLSELRLVVVNGRAAA